MITANLAADMADRISKTQRFCTYAPVAAAVRDLLLGMEAERASQDDWAVMEMSLLYRVDGTNKFGITPYPHMGRMLRSIARRGYSVDAAVHGFGQTLHELRTGSLSAEDIVKLRDQFHLDARPGHDLLPPSNGCTFYGVALAIVEETTKPDGSAWFDVRSIYASTRDGLLWTCQRQRGHEAFAMHFTHEDDEGPEGHMYHGLSLMTQAIAGLPVPSQPVFRNNPLFDRDG